VWFHNEEFRSALYSWVPLDGEPPSPEKDLPHENMEIEQGHCQLSHLGVTVNDKDDCTEQSESKENNEKQESEQPVSQSCDQSDMDSEKISVSKPENEKPENTESSN
ncbi:Hypothetical predicted protein, partial [Paramuricea clavata]